MVDFIKNLKNFAKNSKAWPFLEAKKIIKHLDKIGYDNTNTVVFQTGYGPSGLPHIGTFCEVARTVMVQNSFKFLTGLKTKLLCFSDDMDGFRKIPNNLPRQEMLKTQLGLPLSKVKDPFDTHCSLGAHNNEHLKNFLDNFGFNYQFLSATECYKSGMMDKIQILMLEKFDDIMDIILPTLGKERRKTYSPFLPICPDTGIVLQVPIIKRNLIDKTITYRDERSLKLVTIPITGGHCKMQWKADWAMRWAALNVNYEMAGKDLNESVILSSRIINILGKKPPVNFSYELFLDKDGKKISKSKGNGLTMMEWLRYATPESLLYYMYQSPKKSKKLYFEVIPKAMDEYFIFLEKYSKQELKDKLINAVFHVHNGIVPKRIIPISFTLLLNLVSAANISNKHVFWGFIKNYIKNANIKTYPILDKLFDYALAYYEDFIKPYKKFRNPTKKEYIALIDLMNFLDSIDENTSCNDITKEIFNIGKKHNFKNLYDWFKSLYEVLLGQSQGPRFSSFIKFYGIKSTKSLIENVLFKKNIKNFYQ